MVHICYLLAFISLDISFTLAQFAFPPFQFDHEMIQRQKGTVLSFFCCIIQLNSPLSQENEPLYGLCNAKLYPDLSHLEKRGRLTPVA